MRSLRDYARLVRAGRIHEDNSVALFLHLAAVAEGLARDHALPRSAVRVLNHDLDVAILHFKLRLAKGVRLP